MANDYYTTLGLERGASVDAIHKAYRELARKHHPDLHPDDTGAKKKFQEVQAAFDVLSDPKKREMFDRYGPGFESLGNEPGGGGPGGGGPRGWPGAGGGGQSFHFDVDDLFSQTQGRSGGGGGVADFFRQFTGGGHGASEGTHGPMPPTKGEDIEHELTIPFASSILGGQAQIGIQRPDGRTETITVKIPTGIEDGKKIRLRGQGEPGPRGDNGDLMIRIRVSEHPCFRRRGKRLEVTVPITLSEAIAGAKVDVPTPKGTISLQVPSGTSSGKKLRIKGHGVAADENSPGDLFAEMQIILPDQLSEENRKRIAELAGDSPRSLREELRW